MGRVLIVYATRTGETRDIAELIAEGVRLEGHEAQVADARSLQSASELRGYEATPSARPPTTGTCCRR